MYLDHEHAEVLAAVVFTLAAAVHLVRAVAGWGMQVGPYQVPMYASWMAVVVAGYLTLHFWHRIVVRA